MKGNYLGWDVAGIKHHRVHDSVYSKLKATNNFTRGLWLDYDNTRIILKDSCLCGNQLDGLRLEATQGPISVTNTEICHNKIFGVDGAGSNNVLLKRNIIHNNGTAQIRVGGRKGRKFEDWQTGKKWNVLGRGWTFIENKIFGSGSFLLDVMGGGSALDSIKFKGNYWSKENLGLAFRLDKNPIPFSEWGSGIEVEGNPAISDQFNSDPNPLAQDCRRDM